jgi:ComF family protein
LQDAVHALKYENGRQLAPVLGARLAYCLSLLGWPLDVVIPVPLSAERMKTRGYNQAGLLAQAVALETGLTYLPNGLVRIRDTQSQVGLDHLQRRDNVSGAFRAPAHTLEGLSILLIDDVCTTGATLEACAQAALDAGARCAYSLTVTAAQPS